MITNSSSPKGIIEVINETEASKTDQIYHAYTEHSQEDEAEEKSTGRI